MKKNPILWALALAVCLLPGCRGAEPVEEIPPPLPAEEKSPEVSEPLALFPTPHLCAQLPPAPEEEPAEPEEPDVFAALLEAASLSAGDLPGSQLVIVRASGNEASVWAYGLEEETWVPLFEEVNGHVGKNGVTWEKTEGDGRTPAGLYRLSEAFGVEADPGSSLPYRQATGESYWVDDPESQFYNQWVEGTAEKDWTSAEHLADYPEQYAYAAVIDYNRDPVVPGAGSAIFLHCGSRPTAGCVSVPRETMADLLQWLTPERDPAILIY